jgi:hypothetical protein
LVAVVICSSKKHCGIRCPFGRRHGKSGEGPSRGRWDGSGGDSSVGDIGANAGDAGDAGDAVDASDAGGDAPLVAMLRQWIGGGNGSAAGHLVLHTSAGLGLRFHFTVPVPV